MKNVIYMDCHATTPLDAAVLEAMLPYFRERFGNAASRTHRFGWEGEDAVEKARDQVARAIGGRAREIVFTSGATEANNLAIRGLLAGLDGEKDHVVVSAIEHPSVLDVCRALERAGKARVSVVPVDRDGYVDPGDVAAAIEAGTALVSVMAANNEIGTIQPLAEIGRIAREAGVAFHCDATQAVAWAPIDVETAGIDLLSLSAHKIHGPKGVGALWVRGRRPRIRLRPIIDGGGHERGLRSGTLNVPGIVGLGAAIELAGERRADDGPRVAALRDRLVERLCARLDGVSWNGGRDPRLPGNANLRFDHVEAESLLMALQDSVALSSGSACSSTTLEPSHVLRAIGLHDDAAERSVRFGLGRENTEEEVDRVVDAVVAAVERLRKLSPFAPRPSEERVSP